LHCAGQASVNADGTPQHEGDMTGQIGLALDNLEAVPAAAGMTLADVVRLNIYTTDVDLLFEHYGALMSRTREAGAAPPGTLIGVARLAYPSLLVELEATAVT